MQHGEPGVRQTPTTEHIRGMLECVAAVGRLPSPARAGEMVRRLAAALGATAAAVDRVRPIGTTARLAAVGGPPPDGTPSGTYPSAAGDPVVTRTDEDGRATLVSVWAADGRATVLRAWRPAAFDDAEAAAVALLHPHVGPMLVTTPPAVPAGMTGEVLQLMLYGLPEKAIAERLNRSANTVHAHVKRVYKLFGVNSRAQLLVRCRE